MPAFHLRLQKLMQETKALCEINCSSAPIEKMPKCYKKPKKYSVQITFETNSLATILRVLECLK